MRFIELFTKDKLLFLETAGLSIFAIALPFSVSLIQGGILLFLATSLVLRYKQDRMASLWSEIKANPLFLYWLLYLAAGILAAVFGVAPGRSFKALNSDLLTVVSFFALYLFMKRNSRDTALNFYIAAVTAVAAWGIIQSTYGLSQGIIVRAHGASHPVRFGEILVIGLALILSRAAFPKTLSPSAKKSLYAAALVIIAAVLLSQTRGAYLGMLLVFFMLLAARRDAARSSMPLIASVAILGLGLSMLSPTIRYKTVSIFKGVSAAASGKTSTDGPINTRLTLWKTGIKIIKDHPVLGVGPAGVKKVFPDYCPQPYPENTIWGSLHNLYIHQAAERGLVGLAALLALFTGMFIASLRSFRASPEPLTLWALAIMPAWFLMNITEITFQHVHTSYAVLLALATSLAAAVRNTPPRSSL